MSAGAGSHAPPAEHADHATRAAWARDPAPLPDAASVAALVGPETWAEAERWVQGPPAPPAPPRVGPVAWARLVEEEA